jgi:hypothetical protein
VQEQAWPSLGNHPQAARLYAGRGPSSMEPKRAAIHRTPCAFRQVRWSFPTTACLRCRRLAPRLWDASRVAVDIDLDQPVVLIVVVSVHVCAVCGRMFRAQPPVLRPRAIAGCVTDSPLSSRHESSCETESVSFLSDDQGGADCRLPLASNSGRNSPSSPDLKVASTSRR